MKWLFANAIIVIVVIAFLFIQDARKNAIQEDVRMTYNAFARGLQQHDGTTVCKNVTTRFKQELLNRFRESNPELIKRGCVATFNDPRIFIWERIELLQSSSIVRLEGGCAYWRFPGFANAPVRAQRSYENDGRWQFDGYGADGSGVC